MRDLPVEAQEVDARGQEEWPMHIKLDEELKKCGTSRCIGLFLAKNLPLDPGFGLQYSRPPGHREPNGTMTLVSRRGRLFGLTAWHVIELFRGSGDAKALMTRAADNRLILDRFVHCTAEAGGDVDVAIRELEMRGLAGLGKDPYPYEDEGEVDL